MGEPKRLVFDIETAPILAHVWRMFKENVGIDQVMRDWFVLSWAAKWVGEDNVYSDSLFKHKVTYKKNPEDDTNILHTLSDLLDEADFVIGHNSNAFDLPKVRARMVSSGLKPFSPVREIDTLKIAKNQFRFSSNSLAFIARSLGLDGKLDTGGFTLWTRCLRGDREAWRLMEEYNRQDVVLTEQVYHKLAPWSKSHPNFGLFIEDDIPVCTVCGSDNLRKEGFAYTTVGKYQRFMCRACGKFLRARKNLVKRNNLLTNEI